MSEQIPLLEVQSRSTWTPIGLDKIVQKPKLPKRFWEAVSIKSPAECWEFKKYRTKKGYGVFSVDSRTILAHRVAAALSLPDFDDSRLVCHRCDNPPCCNPAHLFVGTYQDNATDRKNKGRTHLSRKLTGEQVLAARIRHRNGESYKTLATEYGVTFGCIYNAINCHTWKTL